MTGAFGLYTHIRNNRVRSGFMLLGLFLLIYVIVFAVALIYRAVTASHAPLEWLLAGAWQDLLAAWPFATIAALIWIAIAYRWHQVLIDIVTGGHLVTRKEEPRLYNLLENLCISRGIPMPKLKMMETDALNAFATGLNQKQYSITVTTGLLERLDDAEIEAVLAHELTHIRNGDVRLMVVAVVIAGIVGFIVEVGFRGLFDAGGSARPSTWHRRTAGSDSGWGWRGGSRGGSSGGSSSGDSKGSGGAIIAIVIAIVLIFVAWFLSQVVRFSLSRSREFLADAGAAELTKNPDAMISALRKIEGRGELPNSPSAVMEMCVDNPRSGLIDLFATHPSVERRVDALVRYAGGRDPGPIAIPDYDEVEHDPAAMEEEGGEQAADAPAEAGDKPSLPGFPPLPGVPPLPGMPQAAASDASQPFLPAEPPLSGFSTKTAVDTARAAEPSPSSDPARRHS
jgi:heat shock protein HtpX